MSQHFTDANDTLAVWDSLKEGVNGRSTIAKNHLINSQDYGFITPTILAGKLSEPKIDELIDVLQGNPAVVWNLSEKPLPSGVRSKLNNQVINAPWVTVGSNTPIPTLDCILTQCYSIKSWLDIRSDHIAIVHCATGRSRSGILIACLLKYIGAFDHASEAFDFFCSTRNLKDLQHSQSMSYNILFENIDKTVDFGGYPNRFPVQLKNIAITGLPADEAPIIEVRDIHGRVYNSLHTDDSESPSWSTEFGDGSFLISHDILGDFTITCRFGGLHSATKDNSTVIFTYQNNTVVELRKVNMDVNKAYSDSLDAELFTVHLMFEEPVPDNLLPETSPQKGVFGRSNFVLPTYTSPSRRGGLAFEIGLDEICKHHLVEVDPNMADFLEKAGHPLQYINSALKLSNNSAEQAAELIQKIIARSADLKGDCESDKIHSNVPFSPMPPSRSSSFSNSTTGHGVSHQEPMKLTSQRLDVDPFTGLETLLTEGDLEISGDLSEDSEDGSESEEDGVKEEVVSKNEEYDPGPPCSECCKDDINKRDQLVPCSACHRQFHAYCLGRRAVPFSIASAKDRQSRQKFISQNYRFWRCSMCATKDLAVSAEADGRQLERLQLSPRRKSDSTLSSPVSSPMPPLAIKTDAPERTASWTGPQSGSKVSFATTYPVGGAPKAMVPLPSPGKKKPPSPHAMMTPLRRVSSTDKDNRPSKSQRGISNELSANRDVQPRELTATSSGSGSSWMFRSRMSQSLLPVPAPPPPRSQTKHDQAAALMGLLAASGLTMESLLQMNEEKQRETLIAAATIRNSSRLTEQERLQLRRGQSAESDAASKRVSMKALVSFKLPPTPEVNESPDSPPVPKSGTPTDPRKAMMAMLAKRGGGEEPAPEPSPVDPRMAMMAMLAKRGGGEEPAAEPSPVDPRKAMMAMLAKRGGGEEPAAEPSPVDPRKAMMAMLAKRGGGEEPAPVPSPVDPRKAMMAMLAKRGGGEEPAPAAPNSASNGAVALKDCPTFGKYFKMMKVGLPRPAVVQKMMSDGAVSSEEKGLDILALGGDGPSPIPGVSTPAAAADPRKAMMDMLAKKAGGSESAASSSGTVPLKDCKTFGKYFKMMKVGLPTPAVVQKMMSDGAVSSEQKGFDILALGGDGPSPILGQAPAGGGDAAKNMMDMLAKRSGGVGGAPNSDPKVALKDHPSYAKYFKMLKVGLPKDNVKFKMEQDGLDKDILDRDPESLVSSKDPKAAAAEEAEDVAVSYHPKYGKYFRMLSVRLPKDAIKAKMEADGLDPDFLDKNPEERIPRGMNSEDMLSEMPHKPAALSVTFADHPQYGKFFKMLKVGLPKEAVKSKMTNEGLNPDFLDMNATDMVPQEKSNKGKSSNRIKSQRIKSQRIKSVAHALTALGAGAKGVPKVRKKKLYWKALTVNQVGSDSMWNEDEIDITLDEAEFNKLFVETDDAPKKKEKADAGETTAAVEESKRKRVNLIDAKRGQNAGIALARIKVGFPEVRERITLMKDDVFTTDQLRYLLEYLPSEEESAIICNYAGDAEMLGQAEKYMKEMSGFPAAAKHIQAMIYKQQLKIRVNECCATLSVIEGACDDVKMCVGFKKVLKTILKVGNQMNDGEKHLGFTLDSLLKLQSAKAFDKKTSILQYVIMLIYRNDEKCLDFPNELTHCAEASRLTLDSAHQEQVVLKQGHEASLRIVSAALHTDASSTVLTAMSVMTSFLSEAKQMLEELSAKVDGVKKKFASVLAYFGEESAMSSQDFFSTLTAFITEFVSARDNLERVRRMEKQKEKRERDQAEKTRLRELEKENQTGSSTATTATAPVTKMVGGSKHGARVSPMGTEEPQEASV